jgi:cyclase
MKALLRLGADKISINSPAVRDPNLIEEAALKFGSQCVVVAMDVRRRPVGEGWTIYVNGGRVDTGRDALQWAIEAERRGAGEILLTSMDTDGVRTGYDLPVTRAVAEAVGIPVIASGGAGELDHFRAALVEGKADAALAATLFHDQIMTIKDVKDYLAAHDVPIRKTGDRIYD